MDNHNSGWNPPRAQYPWKQGDELFADELNAAIANASSGVAAGGPFLPLTGGTLTGPVSVQPPSPMSYPAGASTETPIFLVQGSFTGATSRTGTFAHQNWINTTGDNAALGASGANTFRIEHHYGGPAFTGGRVGLNVLVAQTTSGAYPGAVDPANTHMGRIAASFTVQASENAGGTDVTNYHASQGSNYCISTALTMFGPGAYNAPPGISGATNYNDAVAQNMNIRVDPGASATQVAFFNLALTSRHQTHGQMVDSFFLIGRANNNLSLDPDNPSGPLVVTPNVGMRSVFLMTNPQGQWPLDPAGWFVDVAHGTGLSRLTAQGFLNWKDVEVTGNLFTAPGFSVSGQGGMNLGALSIATSGTTTTVDTNRVHVTAATVTASAGAWSPEMGMYDTLGNQWKAVTVDGANHLLTVALVGQAHITGTGPATVNVISNGGGQPGPALSGGSTAKLALTWSTAGSLSLQPSGGTTVFGGPVSYTATGGTTPRTAQDRAADVVNVLDYGAVGDGVTVDTAAIQAAANSLSATGGVLLFPSGCTFLLDRTILLYANTTVMAFGATLTGTSMWNNPVVPPAPDGFGLVRVFFENVNWNVTTLTDTNIRIYGGVYKPPDVSLVRVGFVGFHFVQGVEVAFVRVVGGAGCMAFVSCDQVDAHDNTLIMISGGGIGFGPFTNVRVHHNYMTQNIAHPGSAPMIEFTGSTFNNTEAHSSNFVCDSNQVFGAIAAVYAIQVDETDALSSVKNGIICNNHIDMTGFPGAGGIGAYGNSDNINIHHNTVKGVSDYTCISVFPLIAGVTVTRAHVDNNRILDSTRVSGGATILNVTADDSTVIDNDLINCTCTTPLAVTGANVVVRTGRMDSGSTGSRGSVTGADHFFEDYNIVSGVKTLSSALQSAVGFQIGAGSTLGSYLENQTWTPSLQFGGASTGITYSVQSGTYQKIGKLVFLSAAITLSNKGTATGTATITGFPLFTSGGYNVPLSVPTSINMSGLTMPPYMTIGSNVIQMIADPTLSGGHLTDTNFSNASAMVFSGVCVVTT